MAIYQNPDFRRLPAALASIFENGARESFFALPAWYDLMARHGVSEGTQIRMYADERPTSMTAMLVQTVPGEARRNLVSLTNAHSLEHGLLCGADAEVAAGLGRILAEILAERPQWDCLNLFELDPRDPSYIALADALRRAGLFVTSTLNSGTWYEDTAGLSFAEYTAARPSQLLNTWRRKRRRIESGGRLTKSFFGENLPIDQAVADYEIVYAASWKPPERFPRFVPALIRVAAELGALRLGFYYLDGVPAAVQFWIVWNDRAAICKLAHDKCFDDLSLGTLLTMDMFERVLAEDRPREISLGRGDDAYKKLWLPRRRERWGITAANPRTLRGLQLGIRRRAAAIYHRLRHEPIMPRV